MILACDAGGTKTDLALFDLVGRGLQLVRRETFRSQDYSSLNDIVSAFTDLGAPVRLAAAGFGVPGPVHAGQAKTTNLPWTVDGARLARTLELDRTSLLNDVEAQAWSVLELSDGDYVTLQRGIPDPGNIAVIAAGTGLGHSALVRGDGPTRSLASEGGHADFSPGNDVEIELLRFLQERYGHVSAERAVSGPGLFKIYEFLRERDPAAESAWLRDALRSAGDPTAVVALAALEGRSAVAERAVLLLLEAYGAEAGNWALRTMATGGVWLGGGLARRLLVGPAGTSDTWRERAREAFISRFGSKGRLSPLLEKIPVRVIVSDTAALLGVAHFALSEVRP